MQYVCRAEETLQGRRGVYFGFFLIEVDSVCPQIIGFFVSIV